MRDTTENRQDKLDEAFALMKRALDLLDEAEAPGEIGADLDMAICRFAAAIGRALPVGGADQLDEEKPAEDNGSWQTRPAA